MVRIQCLMKRGLQDCEALVVREREQVKENWSKLEISVSDEIVREGMEPRIVCPRPGN